MRQCLAIYHSLPLEGELSHVTSTYPLIRTLSFECETLRWHLCGPPNHVRLPYTSNRLHLFNVKPGLLQGGP